ncbi:MAG: UDP-N-acetylmuramoyl-tripeptide--D-alanyl-D-alanine ligase [Myxococcota bacterium]
MATPIPENAASFSLDDVVRATSGEAVTDAPPETLCGVAIDSRLVCEGGVFIALRGNNLDGHRFIEDAISKGAGLCIVEKGASFDVARGANFVYVDDTLKALGDLAAMHRRRLKSRFFGLTGSVGKTSTKELLHRALQSLSESVHCTPGNLNNRVGLPMVLLSLDDSVREAVIEMGTSQPGEIGELARIAQPQVGVLTTVAHAHTRGLPSLEAVAEEKGALLLSLASDGVAVAHSLPVIQPYMDRSAACEKVLFGTDPWCQVQVLSCQMTAAFRMQVELRVGTERHQAQLRLLGRGAAHNLAAVVATLQKLGYPPAAVLAALSDHEAVPGRFSIHEERTYVVIDDSYNATPRSTEVALEALAELARLRTSRSVAILGDMLDLGALEDEAHRKVGERVAALGIGLFLATGKLMRQAAHLAEAHGVSVVCVPDADAAAELAGRLCDEGDIVLVKGSRSMAMEQVVSALREPKL